ncbi:hypothetical protein F5X99DRAFT_357814 [Biscogniauxia marginata]|nr:hypothetical protein F5X99DRAFT_357814 [Biscogniauxia marginata]
MMTTVIKTYVYQTPSSLILTLSLQGGQGGGVKDAYYITSYKRDEHGYKLTLSKIKKRVNYKPRRLLFCYYHIITYIGIFFRLLFPRSRSRSDCLPPESVPPDVGLHDRGSLKMSDEPSPQDRGAPSGGLFDSTLLYSRFLCPGGQQLSFASPSLLLLYVLASNLCRELPRRRNERPGERQLRTHAAIRATSNQVLGPMPSST